MRAAFLRAVVVAVALAVPFAAHAQFGHPLKGQWSGQWGPANSSSRLLLDLHWDGKEITGVDQSRPRSGHDQERDRRLH